MRLGPVLLLATFLSACGYVKEYAPVNASVTPVRVPNQQRLVSLAATQAVVNAARSLNLARYAGRSGIVEVNGVFPHSASDLLEYVASALEGEMARAGMRVIPHPTPAPVRPENGGQPLVLVTPNAQEQPQPDVRVVASLDWGGIDMRDQQYVVWKNAIAQLAVGVGGFAIGVATIVGGINTSSPGAFSGDHAATDYAAVIVGGLFTLGGPITALVWSAIDRPMAHQTTLAGRVRITLRAIPNAGGIMPAEATGEGESHIVLDPATSSGYSHELVLPQMQK
jgi:hypothetical protein